MEQFKRLSVKEKIKTALFVSAFAALGCLGFQGARQTIIEQGQMHQLIEEDCLQQGGRMETYNLPVGAFSGSPTIVRIEECVYGNK